MIGCGNQNCAIIEALQDSARKCFQCGSNLILVSKKTETVEGSRFPQTTSIYRCSDKKCQEEKDRETQKRIKLRDKRLEDTENRIKLKKKTRKN